MVVRLIGKEGVKYKRLRTAVMNISKDRPRIYFEIFFVVGGRTYRVYFYSVICRSLSDTRVRRKIRPRVSIARRNNETFISLRRAATCLSRKVVYKWFGLCRSVCRLGTRI